MSSSIPSARPEASPLASRAQRPLLALLIRLHLYVGLFVGPFILVAALSGLIYALTPQLENQLYAEQLFVDSRGPSLPLARQIEVAQAHIGAEATLSAVRPAPQPGTATRVMFSAPGLGPSESRAVFIDPVTTEIRGDLLVYGTAGVLPLRAWLDQFHRSLLMGEPGRIYSELAASWLWVAALGGLALWVIRRKGNRKASVARTQPLRRWHATLGLWLLVGLLFFSATGLTWSRWAGDNIGVARAALGMSTPSVSTALAGEAAAHVGEHAHHGRMPMAAAEPGDPALFDAVLAAARHAGIDAGKLEIVPAPGPDRAWTVTEIDRSWPTQVDAVAIDPRSLVVIDRIDFATFPLAAKLTRWGIDAHMGSLFGLANQLLLAVTALGLATLVIWGYLMWWRRRSPAPRPGVLQALRDLSPTARVLTAGLAVLFGYCLPVLGGSLVLFLFAEWVIGGIRRTDRETLRQPG